MTTSGGHLLAHCLVSLGARRCFGVPGESYLDLLDALHDSQGTLDFTACRNEAGAAFMAEAYGKLTGTPGICLVTRGPGATNASIGVHTAMQSSTPLILFIGQVGDRVRDREAFQEIDYRAFFGPIAKLALQVDAADRIPEFINRAWSASLSGRRGPVVVALPETVLTARSSAVACRSVKIPEASPDTADIEAITSLLLASERPVVLAGGGGWNESGKRALGRFAEKNSLPVVTAFRFNDLIDNHSPMFVGEAGVGMLAPVRSVLAEADLILAIGVRFGEMTTADYTLLESPNPETRLVHAHASDRELGKIYRADLPIHAGPNRLCERLLDIELREYRWLNWTRAKREAYLAASSPEAASAFAEKQIRGTAASSRPLNMGLVMRCLQERLPADAIVTNGAGNFTAWPNKFFRFGSHQRLLAPQSGAMGYGLPAAIAARLTYPNRTVVCFAGDGDLQMNCQELGTAMQCNVRPIILVINNGSYGTIRMHQENQYPGRVSGTDLQNPDFPALARAYGFHAERIVAETEFPDALDRAMASKTGALLELIV